MQVHISSLSDVVNRFNAREISKQGFINLPHVPLIVRVDFHSVTPPEDGGFEVRVYPVRNGNVVHDASFLLCKEVSSADDTSTSDAGTTEVVAVRLVDPGDYMVRFFNNRAELPSDVAAAMPVKVLGGSSLRVAEDDTDGPSGASGGDTVHKVWTLVTEILARKKTDRFFSRKYDISTDRLLEGDITDHRIQAAVDEFNVVLMTNNLHPDCFFTEDTERANKLYAFFRHEQGHIRQIELHLPFKKTLIPQFEARLHALVPRSPTDPERKTAMPTAPTLSDLSSATTTPSFANALGQTVAAFSPGQRIGGSTPPSSPSEAAQPLLAWFAKNKRYFLVFLLLAAIAWDRRIIPLSGSYTCLLLFVIVQV